MDIIPVLDIINNKVVKAIKGDRSKYASIDSKLYNSIEPIEIINQLSKRYSPHIIYIADLDAISKKDVNHELFNKILRIFPKIDFWIDTGLNKINLIKKYKNPKLIVDSFWLDKESRRVRKGWTKGPWPEINKFLYSSMPRHCKGHWSACFPQRTKFKSMKIKHVFPIWNIGDPYIKGDMNKVRKGIENDIRISEK